jgi:putative transposase
LAFERVIVDTLEKRPMRILGYCVMPNHWHFVLWPERDGDLAAFMQRLTVTHVTRWQKAHRRVGYGHLYQSRFKSFPVETDEYLYQVLRYVERNALRANLVRHAEDWPYGSLWIHQQGNVEDRALLSPWPLPRPRKWLEYVNEPETEAELQALRRSTSRGSPFGNPDWVAKTAQKLGLESTLRNPGRPKLH